MAIRNFRDLEVWQKGIDLVEQVYHLTRTYPKHEIYCLTSQTQRASISVPSNIAEGQQRDSTKAFLYHISVALGSLGEVETQLVIAERLKYIYHQQYQLLETIFMSLGRQLRSLQAALKRKLNDEQ